MIQINTINDVIRLAYFLTSSFTIEHVPSADEITMGLTLLNLHIRTDPTGINVPFYQNITFPMVTGQQLYIIGQPNARYPEPDVISNRILDISTAFVTLNKVDYPLKPLSNYEFWGLTNRNIIQSLPRNYFMENTIADVTQLYIYPTPNSNYGCTLQVKTDLDLLTLYTPITQVPQYYQLYLVYLLGRCLLDFRPSGVWNKQKEDEWQRLKHLVSSASDTDLTIITGTSREFRNHGAISILTGGA